MECSETSVKKKVFVKGNKLKPTSFDIDVPYNHQTR